MSSFGFRLGCSAASVITPEDIPIMASDEKKISQRKVRKFIEPYLVTKGRDFRLKDHDPADTHHLKSEDKPEARQMLELGVAKLSELQDILYAQGHWGVLLIFQAMDAAGKDSTIKHVTSGVNPQGMDVYSFKSPTPEELAHDYLWRSTKCLPPRGKIGIFNRSYYEEVLAVRVHPEFLAMQKIPDVLRSHHFWKHRYQDINAFEDYLTRNGLVIRKFFLNVSKKEQKKRFMERLDDPKKNWKFSAADLRERKYWDDYQNAYQKMIRNTSSEHSPWVVVPANNKWFSRLLVVATIVDALQSLNLKYPKLSEAEVTALKAERKALEKE